MFVFWEFDTWCSRDRGGGNGTGHGKTKDVDIKTRLLF